MAHSMIGPDDGETSRALDVLRESQDRALHLEGIPMFAMLADERPTGESPPVSTGHTSGEAERTATILARAEQYRQALAPTRREGDMGVVISLLAVTAYEDFDRSVTG